MVILILHKPLSSYFTIAFLAAYMLAGNVMLLNLLIAIFTSVFEEIQANAKEVRRRSSHLPTQVWKWEMYRLVEEYDTR